MRKKTSGVHRTIKGSRCGRLWQKTCRQDVSCQYFLQRQLCVQIDRTCQEKQARTIGKLRSIPSTGMAVAPNTRNLVHGMRPLTCFVRFWSRFMSRESAWSSLTNCLGWIPEEATLSLPWSISGTTGQLLKMT